MNKSMWNNEAVKAYESGQGVVLVEKPYPHYEPVAYADNGVVNWIADKQFMHEAELYTAPPLRTWVGLTEAECGVLWKVDMTPFDYYQTIEAKLKDKNNVL
jgi:hypothetical protein